MGRQHLWEWNNPFKWIHDCKVIVLMALISVGRCPQGWIDQFRFSFLSCETFKGTIQPKVKNSGIFSCWEMLGWDHSWRGAMTLHPSNSKWYDCKTHKTPGTTEKKQKKIHNRGGCAKPDVSPLVLFFLSSQACRASCSLVIVQQGSVDAGSLLCISWDLRLQPNIPQLGDGTEFLCGLHLQLLSS